MRSALSEPTPKKAAVENLPKEAAGVLSAETVAVKPVHDWGDPLGVDTLFDDPAATPVPEPVVANVADAVVLENPSVEPTKTALMPSIDSKEIDDALDAVRVDLHQEAQQRDEILARQFEQELEQSGQSILEFEASISGTPQMPQREVGDGELELDEVLPHIGSEPSVVAPGTTAGPTAMAEPNFAIKSSSSRSWLPVLILVFLAVLAGVYFWFWG